MTRMARHFESLGQYHDLWGYILLSAPDNFRPIVDEPVNQSEALSAAFDDLRRGFVFVERKIKDQQLLRILREMIEMAYDGYRTGETKLAAHTLQECEGMIWSGRRLPPKHVVEAERRAFGSVTRFKDVVVSPYPYEGSVSDLNSEQRRIFETAEHACLALLELREQFKFLAWALGTEGATFPVKGKSMRAVLKGLEEMAVAGDITAATVAELPFGAGTGCSGLIVYNIYCRNRPNVRAVAITRDWSYEPLRFHFEDPTIFRRGGHDA